MRIGSHAKTELIPKVDQKILQQEEEIRRLHTVIDNLRAIVKYQDTRLLKIKEALFY